MEQNRNAHNKYAVGYIEANKILLSSNVIKDFPCNAIDVLKEQTDIKPCSFGRAENKYGIPVKSFGSKSASLHENYGRYILFYNEKEIRYRIRFSIFHELGHYLLGHKMNFKEDTPEYKEQEFEANIFAAQLIIPEQILLELQRRGKQLTPDFLEKRFDVSNDTAIIQLKNLRNSVYRKDCEKEFDDVILLKYAKILNEIIPFEQSAYFNDYNNYCLQTERDSWSVDQRTRWD